MRKLVLVVVLATLVVGALVLGGCGSTNNAGVQDNSGSEYKATESELAQVETAAKEALEDAYAANPDLQRVKIVAVDMDSKSFATLQLEEIEKGQGQPEDLKMRKSEGQWEMVTDSGFGYIILTGGTRRR